VCADHVPDRETEMGSPRANGVALKKIAAVRVSATEWALHWEVQRMNGKEFLANLPFEKNAVMRMSATGTVGRRSGVGVGIGAGALGGRSNHGSGSYVFTR
jgi:hypothetical protein